MKAALFAALLILCAAPANALWNQNGGGPEGNFVGDVPNGPLDVVAAYRLIQATGDRLDPAAVGPGLINTPHGVTGVRITGENPDQHCTVFRITDLRTGATEDVTDMACASGGRVQAYDATRDLLLVTIDDLDPATSVLALRPDGTVAWTAGPQAAGATNGLPDAQDWYANPVAIDDERGVGYVHFGQSAGSRQLLQAIDLDDGTTRWATVIAMRQEGGPAQLPGFSPDATEGAESTYFVAGLAVTNYGIVVAVSDIATSAVDSVTNNPATHRFGLATFTLDGVQQSGFFPLREPNASPFTAEAYPYSLTPAAQGAEGLALIGDRVFIVNVEEGSVEQIAAPTHLYRAGNGLSAGPAWYGDDAFIPLRSAAFIVSPSGSRELREWPLPSGHQSLAGDVLGTQHGTVLAAAYKFDGRATVFEIDLATGRTLQATPVSEQIPSSPRFDGLIPTEQPPGVLLFGTQGDAIFFQARPPQPVAHVSTLYPSVGGAVSLEPRMEAPLSVSWGDGYVQELGPGEPASRVFTDAGIHTMRVTAVLPDGTTQTEQFDLDVGGTAPQELNALQRAFAPANQDTTWGVIGVILVLLGATATLASRRVGRTRIAAGLRELASIRDSHAGFEGIGKLQAWHRRQEERMLAGRLTEDQFRVLENRGARLMRGLVNSTLQSAGGAFPKILAQRLEAAYSDGFVDPAEIDGIRSAAKQAKLPAAKRRVLNELLAAWS